MHTYHMFEFLNIFRSVRTCLIDADLAYLQYISAGGLCLLRCAVNTLRNGFWDYLWLSCQSQGEQRTPPHHHHPALSLSLSLSVLLTSPILRCNDTAEGFLSHVTWPELQQADAGEQNPADSARVGPAQPESAAISHSLIFTPLFPSVL